MRTWLQLSLQFFGSLFFAQLASSAATAQETERASEYLRCLAKAEKAWRTHQPAMAWEELENCPAEHRGWEWHYLRQSCVKMRDLGETNGTVVSVSFTGDNARLHTTSYDGTQRAWNTVSGKNEGDAQLLGTPLAVFHRGNDSIRIIHAGEQLFCSLEHLQKAHPLCKVLSGDGCAASFSGDGKFVAVTIDRKTIKAWETASGKQLHSVKHDEAVFAALALSADGRHVAAAAPQEEWLCICDLQTGKWISREAKEGIRELAYSPDGAVLASAGRNGLIRIWDTERYQEVAAFTGHTKQAKLAFRGDGKVLVSAGADQQIRTWDMTAKKEGQTLPCEQPVSQLAFSGDGSRIAVTTEDRRVLVFEHPNFQASTVLCNGPAGWIRAVAIHPDGKRLATAENDGSIRLWQIGSTEPLQRLKVHEGSVRSLAYSPDGARLVSAGSDGALRIWDTTSAREMLSIRGHKRIIRSVSFASDGRRIASAGDDGVIRVWDSASGAELMRLDNPGRGVFSVAFSPDGHSLAATVLGGDIHLWNLSDKTIARTFQGHTDIVNCIVFSPDGKRLASASNDRAVKIWEVASGLAQTLRGHTANVQTVAFSPDGKRLTSAGWDKSVKFWDAHTGRIVLDLEGGAMINSIAYGPSGHYLAIVGFDRQPCIWNATPATEVPGRQ